MFMSLFFGGKLTHEKFLTFSLIEREPFQTSHPHRSPLLHHPSCKSGISLPYSQIPALRGISCSHPSWWYFSTSWAKKHMTEPWFHAYHYHHRHHRRHCHCQESVPSQRNCWNLDLLLQGPEVIMYKTVNYNIPRCYDYHRQYEVYW